MLKAEGLSTLPGTAAEILDDEVRAILCPDKINSAHVSGDAGRPRRRPPQHRYHDVWHDRYEHWAAILKIRTLQVETEGFTEFVLLPFVAEEAPIYLKGRARRGPTSGNASGPCGGGLSYPRLFQIFNARVKLGHEGVAAALGRCNDLGGTLMNETITRPPGLAGRKRARRPCDRSLKA